MKVSMYRVVAVFLLSFLLAGTAIFARTTQADEISAEHEHESDVEPGVTYQDERAALDADIAVLAQETGLPVATVAQAVMFQQAFTHYADELMARFPDQVSAVWVEPVPNTRGHIQFTGEVPAAATTAIASMESLDANNIILTGDGLISMHDHIRRAELAAVALRDLGYEDAITFFDPTNQVLVIELQIAPDAPQPDTLEIVKAVQDRVYAEQTENGEARFVDRAALVDIADIKFTILTGSGPMVIMAHSRGGNWLRDDGVRECTSGWSVNGASGDGIITAGHCNGLNQFEQPGVTPYSMTFRSQVHGAGGDVEYHTTSHAEYAEFYSSASTIRDVTGLKTTNTMVGSVVCVYGRASNVRTCDHTVEAVGITVVSTGVGNLARTDNNSLVGGDSGGGWSVGTVAWGVTHGYNNLGNSYFTPVQAAQTALNVTIKTK